MEEKEREGKEMTTEMRVVAPLPFSPWHRPLHHQRHYHGTGSKGETGGEVVGKQGYEGKRRKTETEDGT